LTITTGKLRGKDFTITRPGKRLVGRAEGCDVRFPSDREHLTISRLHCLLEVDPAGARLWDFDSRNGTYVNGQRIRPGDPPAPAAREADLPGCVLKDGDEIRLGDAVLRVQITAGEAEPGQVEAAAEASSFRHLSTTPPPPPPSLVIR
jgi:pSer/pThr/pTyr-binding forkhead associated (FHA) protein